MTDPLPLPPSRQAELEQELCAAQDRQEQAMRWATVYERENAELLRVRDAFRDRLERGRDALDAIAIEKQDQRVRGKAQGIDLALSYLDEWERGVFR